MSFISGVIKRLYWKRWKPELRGVACLIECNEKVLLIRHRYGKRSIWTVPNGKKKRYEKAKRAVVREVWNLIGVDVRDAVPVTTILTDHDHPDETVHAFIAHVPDPDTDADPDLIAEIRWFAFDEIPPNLSLTAKALLQKIKFKTKYQVCEADPDKPMCGL